MIVEQLIGKTSAEKVTLKGAAIANAFRARGNAPTLKPRTKRKDFDIEIVDINEIEGGVEVFARAWKDNKQVGFGRDGTVDIERFRFYNPPVLAIDPAGDIVRIQEANEEMEIPYQEFRFREDPEEALLQSLEHTLSVMKHKHTDSRIVKGKIGNTTSTFYPDAGTGGTTVDGQLNHSQGGGTGVTWSTLRSGAGTAIDATATTMAIAYLRATTTSNRYNLMIRGAITWDTSVIGTDNIDSAVPSVYPTSVLTLIDLTANITTISLAANNNLQNSDYALANFGSTKLATGKLFSTFTTSVYNNFTLNASGLAAINKTGITAFGFLTEEEIDNSEPTYPGTNGVSSVIISSADQTGTTQDPKLVVEHTAGGAPPTGFRMMMGVGI